MGSHLQVLRGGVVLSELCVLLRLLCLGLEDGQAGDERQGAKDEGCPNMSLRNCCLWGGRWNTKLCSGFWCLLSLCLACRPQPFWILVSAVPLPSSVTLGRLPYFLEPQFPHLENGGRNTCPCTWQL